jgi:hypothetical protein
MNSRMNLVASILIALTCACACSGRSARRGAEAVVAGTILDAATGAPVPDIRVEGPQGACAISGRDGRFEMAGLRAGDEGEILARAGDGRRGGVTLRPLAPGRLEVVLQLYRR